MSLKHVGLTSYNKLFLSGIMLKLLSVCRVCKAFLGGSVVNNLPATQETWVQLLDWEDPLEKEIATHFSILA